MWRQPDRERRFGRDFRQATDEEIAAFHKEFDVQSRVNGDLVASIIMMPVHGVAEVVPIDAQKSLTLATVGTVALVASSELQQLDNISGESPAEPLPII